MHGILVYDRIYSEYYSRETECEGVVIRLWDGSFGDRIFDREKITFFS